MDAGQLINALSASLFALLGIWAAVVRRHWFLRAAIGGGLLTLALLIPAYEVVIEFGVAMALIAIGVWIARGRPNWQARLSLETALLAMVVAAVAAAFLGAAPTYGLEQWIRLVGVGITVSYFALLCLWMVCGHARPIVRIVTGLLGVAAYVVVMYVGEGVLYAASGAASQSWNDRVFWLLLEGWFTRQVAGTWASHYLPAVGAGVGVMLIVIAAARSSGWFTSVDDGGRREFRWAARALVCVFVAAVAAPNLYLLYRLCTPLELPREPLPAGNVYNELLAAGAIAGETLVGVDFRDVFSWSDAKLSEITDRLPPVFQRVDACVGRPSWATVVYGDSAEMELINEKAWNVLLAKSLHLMRLSQQERYDELARACCQFLRIGQALIRGQRAEYDFDGFPEQLAVFHLEKALGALSAQQCRELARELAEIDAAREPYERRRERQRAFDSRTNWQSHLHELIADWSGQEPASANDWEWQVDRQNLAALRLMVVNAALHAYWREHGRLPEALEALVPEYLAELPRDPWDGAPVRYRVNGGVYRIYCVGWDGVDHGGLDHGGLWDMYTGNHQHRDMLCFGPHFPPMRRAVKERLTSGATQAWSWLKTAVAAAREAAPPTAD